MNAADLPKQPFRLLRLSWPWLAAYLALQALIVGGVIYGRQAALAVYGSTAAQTEWDVWREDARQMASAPWPVKRRVPKSAEPPALVLMRDHFAVCLGGAVVLSSVLFGTFMVLVRGALGHAARSERHDRLKEPFRADHRLDQGRGPVDR